MLTIATAPKAVLAPKAASFARRSSKNARVVVVRNAEESNSAPAEAAENTVFYAGKSYTESEYKNAVANGTIANPAPAEPTPAVSAPGFGDLMAFNGAPELINGRLSMIAFVAALGAELSSGESVLRQFTEEPTGIALTALVFTAATLIPMLQNAKRDSFGPFTPQAEMTNGRAAMLGFAALIAVEAVKGSALF